MARYLDAIEWLALNDDNEWLAEPDSALSATASLVADVFGKPDDVVKHDLANRLEAIESLRRL